MKLRWLAYSTGAITVGAGFFGAYLLGQLSTRNEAQETWLDSQANALVERTQVAAVMRSGDTNSALKTLETQIDMDLIMFDGYSRQNPPSLDKRALSALKLTSMYREKYQNEYLAYHDALHCCPIYKEVADKLTDADRKTLQSALQGLSDADRNAQDSIRHVLSVGSQQGQLTHEVFADKYLRPNKPIEPTR